MAPTLINKDGSFNRSAIMRDAHRIFRRFRDIRPTTTLGERMRQSWEVARKERQRWLVDRLSGGCPATAFALNGAIASKRFHLIDLRAAA